MTVKLCVLASSSSGNATFIAAGRTRLLIDCGLSGREVERRLAAIGEQAARLDGILVTHEHSDHVSGLATLAQKHAIPVYLTELAAPALEWKPCGGAIKAPIVETFQAGRAFSIGDFDIQSFTIPHDAIDPVGFTLTAFGTKTAIATDLGYVTESLRMHLRGCDVLLLESNHDLEMLRVGPYPWSVKQRVMSRRGHLSNEVAASFIRDDLDLSVKTLILGHLSPHNNHPELVRAKADQALSGRRLFTRLVVVDPGTQSEAFVL